MLPKSPPAWRCLNWRAIQGSQPVFRLHPSIICFSVWWFQSGAALMPKTDLAPVSRTRQICTQAAGKPEHWWPCTPVPQPCHPWPCQGYHGRHKDRSRHTECHLIHAPLHMSGYRDNEAMGVAWKCSHVGLMYKLRAAPLWERASAKCIVGIYPASIGPKHAHPGLKWNLVLNMSSYKEIIF